MNSVVFGNTQITVEDIFDISFNKKNVLLSENQKFRDKVDSSQKFVSQLISNNGEMYGVTTGYGDSCVNTIEPELIEELPLNLVNYHRCGLGDFFNVEETRAIQAVRLTSLCRGVSGVSQELLELLAFQIQHNITPLIPQEGSVGASGDLTPLAYLAASLIGEGEVLFNDTKEQVLDLYKKLGVKPIRLKPKEGLAMMNGTSVMTALACLAYMRAQYLCQWASRITAMNVVALKSNPQHFDAFLYEQKPHIGQAKIAEWIRNDLKNFSDEVNLNRLQERYSIRCAPHIIGVLQDALPFFKNIIETELNSANDNPLIDIEREEVIHGGNFYGGHIAFVMDGMKNLVANIADMLDRQMALLVDVKFNNGLASNLSGAQDKKSINHGFKAVQISCSAWTAEALKQSLPMSIFSRSTECHNQDKVSMGTIAARDCLRVLELTEQVLAAVTFASLQAVELRLKTEDISKNSLGTGISEFRDILYKKVNFVEKDRPLDREIRILLNEIRQRNVSLYL